MNSRPVGSAARAVTSRSTRVFQQVVGGVAQRLPVHPAAQLGDRPIGALRCSARAGSSVLPASCTTESRRSRCNSVTTVSPGRPRSYSRVRAESRFRAGPKVSVVAKIHNARSAVTGATTSAVSFERIGQSRVFIRPRPYRGGRRGAGTAGQRACRLRARRRRRAPARAPWAGYVIGAVALPPVASGSTLRDARRRDRRSETRRAGGCALRADGERPAGGPAGRSSCWGRVRRCRRCRGPRRPAGRRRRRTG